MKFMKNKFILILAVISLAALCLTASSLPVAQATMVSDSLVQEGIKLYEEGDQEKAVERLSKALIIDPDNQAAKDYLKKMGMDAGLFQPEKGAVYLEQKDRAREIKDYQDQLNALEREKGEKEKWAQTLAEDKAYLKEAIDQRNRELENLRQELDRMRDEIPGEQEKQESLRAQEEQAKAADHLKTRVDRQLTLIEEKDRQIKQLQKQLTLTEKEARKKSLGYEHKILDLKAEHRKSQSQDFKKDLEKDQEIQMLQSRLRSSRAAVEALNNNILLINRNLTSLENKLITKDEAIQGLNKTLAAQREACLDLKNESAVPEKEKPAGAGLKNQDTCPDAELYRRQDRQIADFKKRLAQAQKDMTALRQNVTQSAQEDASVLKEQLAGLETELKKRDAVIADEEASYEILEQRLKDAQERLGIANKMIQEKDRQIKDMEKEISDIGDTRRNPEN